MLDAVQPRRPRLGAGAGPLIGFGISIGPGVWRIGPAWAVLAGALASGAPLLGDAMPLRLVGAAILADSVWGVLWRLTAADDADRANPLAEDERLPYFQPQSPAGRALGMLHDIAPGASWRELMAALALTGVLSLLLGVPALVLSILAYAVILWAWALGRADKQPAVCDALLNVGLPWLLGLLLARDAFQLPVTMPPLLPGVTIGRRVHGAAMGRAKSISVGREPHVRRLVRPSGSSGGPCRPRATVGIGARDCAPAAASDVALAESSDGVGS